MFAVDAVYDPKTAILLALIGFAGIALTTLVALRNGRRTKDVKAQVGETNGQGSIADMVSRIDITTLDTVARVTTMDHRHLEHEANDTRNFAAINETLTRYGNTIDAIANHVFDKDRR